MNWLFTPPFAADIFQPTLIYADKSAAKDFLLLIQCRGSDEESDLPVEGTKYSKTIGSHFLYSPNVEESCVVAFKPLKLPVACSKVQLSAHPWRNTDPTLSYIESVLLGFEQECHDFQVTIPGMPIDE